MIPAASLDFLSEPAKPQADVSEPAPGDANAGDPQVFVQTLSAPPGWPWEQRRSAELEARHGAPLPISELLYRVRRLEPWRPGAAARFAAFYVLARDVEEQLEARAEVDGRQVVVLFGRARRPAARTGQVALQAVAIATVLALVIGSVGAALGKRAEATAALDIAEQRAAAKFRQVRIRERLADEQRLLDRQLDRGTPLQDVAADLAWASEEKAPDAHVQALHWRGGMMALEVRGDLPPFTPTSERRIERSKRPVRKGVWLWGVAPARDPPAATAWEAPS